MHAIRCVYDVVHAALCAAVVVSVVLVAWGALAQPHARAEWQSRLADEIGDENQSYCTKWGFDVGTHAYDLCRLDLAELRAREDSRLSPLW
jgi:hypothetical protein